MASGPAAARAGDEWRVAEGGHFEAQHPQFRPRDRPQSFGAGFSCLRGGQTRERIAWEYELVKYFAGSGGNSGVRGAGDGMNGIGGGEIGKAAERGEENVPSVPRFPPSVPRFP